MKRVVVRKTPPFGEHTASIQSSIDPLTVLVEPDEALEPDDVLPPEQLAVVAIVNSATAVRPTSDTKFDLVIAIFTAAPDRRDRTCWSKENYLLRRFAPP